MAMLRRYSHAKENLDTSAIDALLLSMRRLVGHRAYRRDAVSSPALKRHLPFTAGYGIAFDEAGLRRRLEHANLDGQAMRYLTTACNDQLDALRKGDD